jgi:hypothetical protein
MLQWCRIYLELSEGETTAGTDTAVVLDGGASHNGTQLVDGAGSNLGSLGETVLTTTVLAAGLKRSRRLVFQFGFEMAIVPRTKKKSHFRTESSFVESFGETEGRVGCFFFVQGRKGFQ